MTVKRYVHHHNGEVFESAFVRDPVSGALRSVQLVQLSGSTAAEASHQTLAVSSTPVALPAIPASAVGALVTVEDAPVRATWDGTVPTSSLGHKYIDGDAFAIVSRADLLRFRVVKAAADDAVLQITYV